MSRYLFIVFSLCILAGIAHAETAEEPGPRETLNSLLAKIHSLQGNFIQHEYQSGGAPTRTLKGNFKMERPQKLAWHITSPYTQTIISNGTTLFVYDKEIKQLIIQDIIAQELPPFFLLNDKGFEKMHIQHLGENEFLLKNQDDASGDIYMRFANGLPVETHWKDLSGYRVVLSMSKVKANRRIAEKHFRFKAPPHTDIIRQ